MKWLLLVLMFTLSGCLLQYAEEQETPESRIHVGDEWSFEDHVQYWEEKERVHLAVAEWVDGPMRIAHRSVGESGTIFWMDAEGLHCNFQPDVEPYIAEQATIPDGEILDAYSWCIVFPESIVDVSHRISSRNIGIQGVVAPGLPDMDVAWEVWAVVEILYGNETHMEDFWAAAAFAYQEDVQAALDRGVPPAGVPFLSVDDADFCTGTETVTVHATSESTAEGWVDFAPSTPTATRFGQLDGTRVQFSTTDVFTDFEVTVAPVPIGTPRVDVTEISCLVDRTYFEQPWSASIQAGGVEGQVHAGTGRISVLSIL